MNSESTKSVQTVYYVISSFIIKLNLCDCIIVIKVINTNAYMKINKNRLIEREIN